MTTEPRLALLTFRYAPQSPASGALDELNERLLKRINDGGRLYLTKTRARGHLVIRFVIGQTYTTWRHVQEAWDAIVETAHAL